MNYKFGTFLSQHKLIYHLLSCFVVFFCYCPVFFIQITYVSYTCHYRCVDSWHLVAVFDNGLAIGTRRDSELYEKFVIWLTFYKPAKLPRIFPGAPLIFNGAPGNIQVTWQVCSVRKLPRATTNVQKNKSYVGLFISYVAIFISYVGLIKSYVGLYNSYVGDKIS